MIADGSLELNVEGAAVDVWGCVVGLQLVLGLGGGSDPRQTRCGLAASRINDKQNTYRKQRK